MTDSISPSTSPNPGPNVPEQSGFVSELFQAFSAWKASRDWNRMLWFLPAFLLLATCVGAIVWGSLRSKEDLLSHYVGLAEKEFPIEEAFLPQSTNEAKEEAERSQYAELIFRRILQMEPTNKMARFFVAQRMARTGNVPQARIMMREIAPDQSSGFAPGHAWIAIDTFQRLQGGEPIDRTILSHHLAVASEWPDAPSTISVLHSRTLEEKGDIDGALRSLRQRVEKHPEFRLAIAELLMRNQRGEEAKEELQKAIGHYGNLMDSPEESDEDRIRLAQSYVLLSNRTRAKEILLQGLEKDPNRFPLRRTFSNLLLMEFRDELGDTEKGMEKALSILNTASNVDPGNPALSEEMALLTEPKSDRAPLTVEFLLSQFGSGQTNAVTHLILANAYMREREWSKASAHMELCLTKNPDLVLALRNFSRMLIDAEPPQLERAMAMLDRALRIAGPHVETFELRCNALLKAGKRSEAIAELEKGISLQPTRIELREKITELYEAEGKNKEAETQKQIISQIRKQLEERKKSDPSQPAE